MDEQATVKARVIVYEVAIDDAELGFEPAGPLFERYSVGLTGRIDRRWVDCYRKLASDTSFSGFRLEPAVARVSFVCRGSDGPVAVMALMTKLKDLIERTNRAATTAARLEPARSCSESDRDDKVGAGALLARFTRGRS